MAGIIEVKDQGKVRIYDADNSNYVDIVVPSTVSSNRTITIPDATFTIPTSDTVFSSSTITGQSAETSVANDDLVVISDTSASGALKKMTVANLTANAGVAGISSSADATAMTITDAEKIGIGETTPLGLVHIKQADSGQGTVNADTSQLVIEDNSTAGITLLGGTGGTGAIFFGDSGDNDIGLIEYDHGANSMAFKTNATEQMRLTDNGSMLLGGTATQASTPNIYIHAAGAMIFLRRKTSNGNVAEFINTSNEVKGSITVSSTNTSYNTSSDYRLKENVATMEDATTRLKQLQPKRFNYISDESNTVVDGFLAHEVSSIVPEAITGEKDAIKVWQEGEKLPEGVSVGDNKLDENGNTIPDFQSIDQSKLVPLLVKTIQELEARITTFGERIMSEIKVDTVAEKTSANGVTVDGLNIKDSKLVTANSVVTSNVTDLNITSGKIADDAITLAKMASGTDGNIISYDASGNPVAIATGNDGQVLTSTGAGSPPAFETLSTGKVLQVVSATTTSATSTTSTSFVDTALSVAITPSASNSKVLIIAHGGGSATSGNESYLTLIRGSTNLGNATYGMLNWGSSSAAMAEATGLTYLDSPSTTSATTYKLQFKVGGGGTGYFNLNSQVASIVALEVGA